MYESAQQSLTPCGIYITAVLLLFRAICVPKTYQLGLIVQFVVLVFIRPQSKLPCSALNSGRSSILSVVHAHVDMCSAMTPGATQTSLQVQHIYRCR